MNNFQYDLISFYKNLSESERLGLAKRDLAEVVEIQWLLAKIEKMFNEYEFFIDDLNIVKDIIVSLLEGNHLILYGPVGTGKTTIARKLTQLFGFEPLVVTASEEWDCPQYLIGFEKLRNGNFHYEPGPLVEAILSIFYRLSTFIRLERRDYTLGNWLIIDEINRGNVNAYLSSLITALEPFKPNVSDDDFREIYKIIIPDEVVYIPRTFRIIGTMNTFDAHYLFKIPEALKRRFSFVYITPPSDINYELQLIEKVTYTSLQYQLNAEEKDELINIIKLFRESSINIGSGAFIRLISDYCKTMEVYQYNSDNSSERKKGFDSAISKIIVPLFNDIRYEPSKIESIITKLNQLGYQRSARLIENIRKDLTFF